MSSGESFRIMRFGRHREGYLQAQVSVNGAPVYVFHRFGSWQIPREPQAPNCPVTFPGKCVLRDVLPPYNYKLAERARRFIHQEANSVNHPPTEAITAGGGDAAQAA